jgi:hypothetical protein
MTMPPRTLIDISPSPNDTPDIKRMLGACKTLWENAMNQRNSHAVKNADKLRLAIKAKRDTLAHK